jgi:hypothetical protein
MLMSGVASLVGFPSYFQHVPLPPGINLKPDLGRRVQSMSALPRQKPVEDEFSDFEKECAEMESHRQGLLLQYENIAVDSRYVGLSRTKVRQPQRVVSAPALMLSPQEHVETWDDDFEEEQDEIDIPGYITQFQTKFQTQQFHLSEFATQIDALKALFATLIDVQKNVNPSHLERFKNESKIVLRQVEMLLHLADYQEEQGSRLTKQDTVILNELLSNSGLQTFQGDVMFGPELMDPLLKTIPVLKSKLETFTIQLQCL